ncbi:MAG: NUDIX domain-containing protein [candidate division KSB1 bacterium]|nr:NUDIX domain-containing protein [candidate division KSB1 bacterium]
MEPEKVLVSYQAAGGVVVEDDRYLILFRPKKGEYRLPKGHIEPDESPEQAAQREVEEETGCSVEILADLGQMLVEFDWGNRHYSRQEHYFLMKLKNGQVCGAAEEQFEPMWLPYDEAHKRLTFAAEKEWLRRAKNALEGRR